MPRGGDLDLREWLLLSMMMGVDAAIFRELLREYGTPGAARRKYAAAARAAGGPIAAGIKRDAARNKKAADAACKWAHQPGCRILTMADDEYPPSLLEIGMQNPPPLLYVRGAPEALSERPLVAIAGSRHPSPDGAENAEMFAAALVEAGAGVVGGISEGIDSAAHRGALQAGAGPVAVFGTGVDIIYPKSGRMLAAEIAARGGALVSDYPLGSAPSRYISPRRDRIISGLARACLVVEAGKQSASLGIANLANEQGREVFAVPGSVNSPMHKGCHQLIKNGANLAENVHDVLGCLGVNLRVAAKPPRALSRNEILSFIDSAPTTFDEIARRSGMSAASLLAALLELEVDGKIVKDGGAYRRI